MNSENVPLAPVGHTHEIYYHVEARQDYALNFNDNAQCFEMELMQSEIINVINTYHCETCQQNWSEEEFREYEKEIIAKTAITTYQGWCLPTYNSRKYHYFVERRSLCYKYIIYKHSEESLEDDNHDSPDNCKKCMKNRLKKEDDS